MLSILCFISAHKKHTDHFHTKTWSSATNTRKTPYKTHPSLQEHVWWDYSLMSPNFVALGNILYCWVWYTKALPQSPPPWIHPISRLCTQCLIILFDLLWPFFSGAILRFKIGASNCQTNKPKRDLTPTVSQGVGLATTQKTRDGWDLSSCCKYTQLGKARDEAITLFTAIYAFIRLHKDAYVRHDSAV